MRDARPRFVGLLIAICIACNLSAADQTDTKLTADRLLARDHVVEVEVEVDEDDWQSLCDQTRSNPFGDPSDNPFSYFKADVTIDGQLVKNVGIRKKGFIGSLDDYRPSLKIKFDKYEDQSPVEDMVTMTLNNNKQDRSLMSQSLTYYLFRKAGVHAPRVTHATVTVNGDYLGIYSHVESMKKPFLKREYGDASGVFYEGTITDFYPKAIKRLEGKTKKSEKDRAAALKLSELLDADDVDLAAIEKLVNVDYFLKYWAIESVLSFWDGYTQNQNNYFAYQNPKDGKFYFMPWGADSCFAESPFSRRRGTTNAASVVANSILSNRLYQIEGIPDRYKSTLMTILKDVWNEEELLKEIERINDLIFDEFDESQLFEAQSGRRDVERFIKSRRKEIEAELEDWPVKVVAQPRIPFYSETVGMTKGSFKAIWNDGSDVADIELKLNDEKVKVESVSLRAGMSEPRRYGWGRHQHQPRRSP